MQVAQRYQELPRVPGVEAYRLTLECTTVQCYSSLPPTLWQYSKDHGLVSGDRSEVTIGFVFISPSKVRITFISKSPIPLGKGSFTVMFHVLLGMGVPASSARVLEEVFRLGIEGFL